MVNLEARLELEIIPTALKFKNLIKFKICPQILRIVDAIDGTSRLKREMIHLKILRIKDATDGTSRTELKIKIKRQPQLLIQLKRKNKSL